jgi:hypothetical protein
VGLVGQAGDLPDGPYLTYGHFRFQISDFRF